MARHKTSGTRQKNIEIPEGILGDFERFAASRGRSFTEEIIDAMRRHVAHPSAIPEPPPPDPFPDPPKKKGS